MCNRRSKEWSMQQIDSDQKNRRFVDRRVGAVCVRLFFGAGQMGKPFLL